MYQTLSPLIMCDIEDYEELYAITNDGRIWSYPCERSSKYGKWLSPGVGTSGYLYVHFTKGNGHKNFQVHRLVAKAFISNPQNKPQVNHVDGNKLNNFVNNLEWVTSKEDARHKYALGLLDKDQIRKMATGKSVRDRRKLTMSQINELRSAYASRDYTQKELATHYGVCQRVVSSIVNYHTYKDK